MQANNIDQVLARLDAIIDWSIQNRSRVGLFAALYRSVTARVKLGIDGGRFDDAARMNRFDTIFANRYLVAFDAFHAGEQPARAWRVAFETARGPRVSLLQDVLVGMNAHINLDLGIATAEVAPGRLIRDLQRDFETLNEILGELLDEAQGVLGSHSPMLEVIDTLMLRADEAIARFSIKHARQEAWEFAESLAFEASDRLAAAIRRQDRRTGDLGCLIASPPGIMGRAFALVADLEEIELQPVIEALARLGRSDLPPIFA